MKTFAGHQILCVLLLLATAPGQAAEITNVDMWKVDDRYLLVADSRIQAPPSLVLSTLLDFEHFHHLSGGIKETRFLAPGASGLPVGYTRAESCILSFCKSVEKTEYIHVISPQEVVLVADPQRSDFKYSRVRWLIRPDGKGTRLGLEMQMEPDFWIPPLIGPWLIQRKLASIALSVAQRMEYMAASGTPLSQLKVGRAP